MIGLVERIQNAESCDSKTADLFYQTVTIVEFSALIVGLALSLQCDPFVGQDKKITDFISTIGVRRKRKANS